MANKTVTVRPSGGTYTSLSAAIAGEVTANANLTAAGMDGILTISIEGTWSSADTTGVNLAGFTTDATHYVNIVADSANRAGTSLDTGKYRLTGSSGWNGITITISQAYTHITGIQCSNTNANGAGNIFFNANGIIVDACLSYYSAAGNESHGYRIGDCTGWIVRNSWSLGMAYGIDNANNASANGYADNCVFIGGTNGIYCRDNMTLVARNCYAGNTSNADYLQSAFGNLTLTTCYSEDGSRSTPTAAYSTDTFTNVTGGSEDISLVAGSALIEAASDLSAATNPFDWDIAGATRTTWDIGVQYYVAPSTSAFGQILVDGTWHTIDTVSICIGAEWKNVTEIQIVNTNAWKALTT